MCCLLLSLGSSGGWRTCDCQLFRCKFLFLAWRYHVLWLDTVWESTLKTGIQHVAILIAVVTFCVSRKAYFVTPEEREGRIHIYLKKCFLINSYVCIVYIGYFLPTRHPCVLFPARHNYLGGEGAHALPLPLSPDSRLNTWQGLSISVFCFLGQSDWVRDAEMMWIVNSVDTIKEEIPFSHARCYLEGPRKLGVTMWDMKPK